MRDKSDEENDTESSLEIPGVVDKYQAAGKVANKVLQYLKTKCDEGADIYELCK